MTARKISLVLAAIMMVFSGAVSAAIAQKDTAKGWISLFDGHSLDGWQVSQAAAESWSIVDGVIDCDPRTRLSGDRHLWTEDAYGDFILYIEWRLTDAPTIETRPLIGPDGREMRDEEGNVKTATFANADSGILLRGTQKSQVNIWNWPVGSGEVWGYRNDPRVSDEVRAAVTPNARADNPVGQWNTFVILMIGDRLSVILNGQLVISHAQLPGVATSGPLGLQYHGGYDFTNKRYRNASSLVQFRNIYIKPLD